MPPKRRAYVKSITRRIRRRSSGAFRSGSGRKLRYARFSRRSYVPGLMPESKYVDAAYGLNYANPNPIIAGAGAASITVDATGPATAAADLNAGGSGVIGIAGGAGFNQRIGRKIFLKYLSVRIIGRINTAVSLLSPIQAVRVMLFYDRQPNLALPVAADIMNVNPGLTVTTFHEDRNRDRFVTLWDHTMEIMGQGNVPAGNFLDKSQVVVTKRIKIGGIQVYNDTALGGVANIQTGSLVWCFLWDGNGAVGPNLYSLDLVTRLRFSDM